MRRLYTLLGLIACPALLLAQTTLAKPEAKLATSITSKAFTANWGAVAGAEAYCAFVYTQTTVQKDGWQTLADEDFSYITSGSLSEPAGGDEVYVDLAEYGYTQTYGWTAYAYPNFIPSMVAGLLYSPYLDLRGNNGRYRIIITSYCSDGDELRIESHGTGEKQIHTIKTHVENGGQGISTDTLDLDNGSKDLFFSVINTTADDGAPDYFDRIQVLQELKAGDTVTTMIASNEAIEATDEYTGDSITSCRFSNLTYLGGQTTVYYDVYATAIDFSTPNGSLPYTALYSDFSDLVKVDLARRTSDFVTTAIRSIATERKPLSAHSYNLAGQRVPESAKGIVIRNGRKVLMK